MAKRIAFLLMIVAACAAAANAQPLRPADEEAVRKVVLSVEKALNDRDMKAYRDQFWDDADWINVMGMYWHGKENVSTAHEVYMSSVFKDGGYSLTDMSVRGVAPDVAVVVATEHTIDQTSPGGNKIPAGENRLSFVLVKRDGQWKIVLGHNTPVEPRAKPFDPIGSHWRPKAQ